MIPQELRAALDAVTPGWPTPVRAAFADRAMVIRKPEGQRLFSPGDACQGYVVVLQGAVRVEHMGATGRSVVLYRVAPGDTCVMTTSCLVTGSAYRAWGYAEGEVVALAISPESFQSLIDGEPAFRAMALGVFANRIRELVEVIDELLLHRVDLRLAAWLAEAGPSVAATHQAIAGELGTAREVVSRILKEFERRGWIALSRGAVAVLDAASLKGFAAQK